MAQTNPSCVLYGAHKVRIENRPIPEIEDPHDVLIRISYVGVCGSDVHFWEHGGILNKVSEEEPIVMGHEASGIVHTVGPAVTTLKAGDRVAIEPGVPCRRCKLCKAGRYNLCARMKFAAAPPGNDGTLARFFRVPEDFAYKIPDFLSLQEAVLVEPLSVAVHGARLADIRPAQTVLVLGSGTIGLLAAATARAYGAKNVCVADINTAKLDFAKEYLACDVFIPDTSSAPEQDAKRLKKERGMEGGFDVILECTGVESSVQTGIYATCAGGVLVQIGLGKPMQSLPVVFMGAKEITLKPAFRYSQGDYEIALELLASKRVVVEPLVSSTVSFENAAEAWEKTRKGEGIKNLIEGVQD